ncbi:MAG: hypothetical protein H0X60_02515 [Chloroflexi bacterium]|nr:hypothetical protein [Chloroflexota bacterium]
MTELHEALAARVAAWREDGYPHDPFPAAGEILQYAIQGEEPDAPFRRRTDKLVLKAVGYEQTSPPVERSTGSGQRVEERHNRSHDVEQQAARVAAPPPTRA